MDLIQLSRCQICAKIMLDFLKGNWRCHFSGVCGGVVIPLSEADEASLFLTVGFSAHVYK